MRNYAVAYKQLAGSLEHEVRGQGEDEEDCDDSGVS